MTSSHLERTFLFHCRSLRFPEPEQEYQFHPTRKFRFDFAWPELMIAVEIEGAVWRRGRHTRGAGYTKDLEKYNLATKFGWKVYRFESKAVTSGRAIAFMDEVFKK